MSWLPRLDPGCYLGVRRHFLTFCTHARHPWFTDPAVVELVNEQFLHSGRQYDLESIAHCFMPDHVHLLVEGGTDKADCRAFVHCAKQRSGYAFARRWGGRLWQSSYYDHVLRDDESVIAVARYILENPLRAGLARAVEDYPFVGSSRYAIRDILESVRRDWQP
jgi:putative transposase